MPVEQARVAWSAVHFRSPGAGQHVQVAAQRASLGALGIQAVPHSQALQKSRAGVQNLAAGEVVKLGQARRVAARGPQRRHAVLRHAEEFGGTGPVQGVDQPGGGQRAGSQDLTQDAGNTRRHGVNFSSPTEVLATDFDDAEAAQQDFGAGRWIYGQARCWSRGGIGVGHGVVLLERVGAFRAGSASKKALESGARGRG